MDDRSTELVLRRYAVPQETMRKWLIQLSTGEMTVDHIMRHFYLVPKKVA